MKLFSIGFRTGKLNFSPAIASLLLMSSCLITALPADSYAGNKKNRTAIEQKADKILAGMTLEEKIGQMTQVDENAIVKSPEDITKYYIGSLLSGGNSEIADISPKGWADVYDKYQSYALKTRLKIPMIYGIDAVHGHNNVSSAVIFPHNIGLGCTRNPKLVEKASMITAKEIAATGIDWTFAPCVAVVRDERWGRSYESFGESPELVKELGASAVKGLQGRKLDGKTSVLSCAKHFLGDGATVNGKDQGDTQCDEKTLREVYLPAYIEAIKAGAGSIMVSFSSWNGKKMHGNKYLLTDLLKKELGFEGFLVSDWAAIDQLPGDYKSDIEESINAGLDMVMIPFGAGTPNNYIEFVTYLKELVASGKVPVSRIDDAVRRILKIKLQMGLFEHPYTDRSLLSSVGSAEHRQIARDCVRQSLVLLKNQNRLLPLNKNIGSLLIAGSGADNLGMQCGGWTISWQGKSGNTVQGTSILSAIKNAVSNKTKVKFAEDIASSEKADAAIVVIGEEPYAEMEGDRKDLSIPQKDRQLIESIKAKGIPCVVVLLSGRPMILGDALDNSDALIAAWLPGSEGQGVADVLFGDYKPTGKLSFSWPSSMEQIPVNIGDKTYEPLFRYGFGLSY